MWYAHFTPLFVRSPCMVFREITCWLKDKGFCYSPILEFGCFKNKESFGLSWFENNQVTTWWFSICWNPFLIQTFDLRWTQTAHLKCKFILMSRLWLPSFNVRCLCSDSGGHAILLGQETISLAMVSVEEQVKKYLEAEENAMNERIR